MDALGRSPPTLVMAPDRESSNAALPRAAFDPQTRVPPPAAPAPPVAPPAPAPPVAPAPPTAPPPGWERLLRAAPNLLALVLAVALCVGIGVRWQRWIGAATDQWTDDATVQSDVTPLAALVAAPVQRVLVTDYQAVRAGQELVTLDPRIYAAELAQAEARVTAAHAALTNLQAQEELQRANIDAATAATGAAEATNWLNALEATRQSQLLATGIAGTQQRAQQADAAHRVSEAQLRQSEAALGAAQRQLDVLRSQEAQLRAALAGDEAQRDLARINLGYTHIVAPTDGMVGRRLVFPGQFVGVGTQAISVVPLDRLYVIANYKETQLERLRPSQPASVRVDSFSNLSLSGRVVAWSPATGAQFALLPPDNATGNFTKVVQRIPVKIALDPDPALARLRPGMSVEVTIHTEDPPPHPNRP